MAADFRTLLLTAFAALGCGESTTVTDASVRADVGGPASRPDTVPDELDELIVAATLAYELRLEAFCACNAERCVDLSPALDLGEARCVVSMLDDRDAAPVYRYYEALLDFSWDLLECIEPNECDTDSCLAAAGAPDALLHSPSENLDPAIEACVSR